MSSDKISKNIQVEQLGNSRDGLRLTWVYFRCMDTRARFGPKGGREQNLGSLLFFDIEYSSAISFLILRSNGAVSI